MVGSAVGSAVGVAVGEAVGPHELRSQLHNTAPATYSESSQAHSSKAQDWIEVAESGMLAPAKRRPPDVGHTVWKDNPGESQELEGVSADAPHRVWDVDRGEVATFAESIVADVRDRGGEGRRAYIRAEIEGVGTNVGDARAPIRKGTRLHSDFLVFEILAKRCHTAQTPTLPATTLEKCREIVVVGGSARRGCVHPLEQRNLRRSQIAQYVHVPLNLPDPQAFCQPRQRKLQSLLVVHEPEFH
eukprot:m.126373 g.126373  ORF g.126373 m.126373 type:complete len:244 (+) comp13568_c2_seq2:1600-2331(+)